MSSRIVIFLTIMISLAISPKADAQVGGFDDISKGQSGTQPLTTVNKLAKRNKAIVIAGGRYYTTRLIWGKVTGSLTGYFFREPNKPRATFYGGADALLIKSDYNSNTHRVSEVDAGSWIMYSWLGQMPYVNVSPKDSFDTPIAKFRIKPGDVIYIGELYVNHYIDEDKKGNPVAPKLIELHNNMKDAREALKREYPNLVKHMKSRPMELVKKK